MKLRQAFLLLVCGALLVWVAVPAAAQHADQAAGSAGAVAQAEHGEHGAAAPGAEDPHATAGHEGVEHEGAEHAEHDPYHLPNFVGLLWGRSFEGARESYLDPLFSALAAIAIVLALVGVARHDRLRSPTRFQAAMEMLVETLDNMVVGVIGPRGRRYTPYLGTLFIFIWVNNLMGLFPLLHASTSSINTTMGLAICTFLYVQFIGIKENGPLGYLHHLAGSPRSGLEWAFVPLMFPLHVLGEFIKPVSLGLRLFGNVMGEDKLIAVFAVLGAGLLAFAHLPFGIPLHVPIVFLAILTGTIQALVFALLSTAYIALMLPHDDHGEAHGH